MEKILRKCYNKGVTNKIYFLVKAKRSVGICVICIVVKKSVSRLATVVWISNVA